MHGKLAIASCERYSRSVVLFSKSVCLLVCMSVTRLRPTKEASRIGVLHRVETHGDPRNVVLDKSVDFLPQIRCGLRQITLATHLLHNV